VITNPSLLKTTNTEAKMAHIQERKTKDGKSHFRVQIRLKGYPITSGTFERRTDAKLWVQQTESAMREGRFFKTSESKKHTLSELVDRYIENVIPTKLRDKQTTTAQLRWWKKQIGHCLLSDLTPALIAEQRDILLKGLTPKGTVRSPSTVVRYLAALSHALTIAMKEWGWLEDSPMRKVTKPKEPRGRVRFLSELERTSLLEACRESTNSYLYPVVVLALSTGMRQGEIMNLRFEDIDTFKGRITLHHTKNGERRSVPLRGLALQLIREMVIERKQDIGLLFPSKEDINKPIDLRFPWEQALKKAAITDFRFHDCRHSCASYLLMNGASSAEIAEVLGHKTLAMVKRYSHLSEAHATHIVEKMNKNVFEM
jgi:integrase